MKTFIFKRSHYFGLKNSEIRGRIKVKTFLRDHYKAARKQIQLLNAACGLKSLPTPVLVHNVLTLLCQNYENAY